MKSETVLLLFSVDRLHVCFVKVLIRDSVFLFSIFKFMNECVNTSIIICLCKKKKKISCVEILLVCYVCGNLNFQFSGEFKFIFLNFTSVLYKNVNESFFLSFLQACIECRTKWEPNYSSSSMNSKKFTLTADAISHCYDDDERG